MAKAMQRLEITAGFLLLCFVAGCTSHPTDQQVQQQAAQTTQQVKQSAEDAAAKARIAAASAEDKINAVAAGVRQGLQEGTTAPVDLNSATADQLVALPGISGPRARRIIAGRPYSSANDLVSRKILTPDQFHAIRNQVTAK